MILKLLIINNCKNCNGAGCPDCTRGVFMEAVELSTIEDISSKVLDITKSVTQAIAILDLFGVPR